MSEAVAIPSPKTTFTQADGQTFELDLLSTIHDLEIIGKRLVDEKKSHTDYLAEIIAYVSDKAGALLTVGEADWLKDQLWALHAKKKQKQREDITALLGAANTSDATHLN